MAVGTDRTSTIEVCALDELQKPEADVDRGDGAEAAAKASGRGRGTRASLAVFADFWLDEKAQTSLWMQLYQQLRQAIISRRLSSGTRLPATRLLAEELRCSRNTVLGAFEQLVAEGYLEGRVGSGTYVAEMLPDKFDAPRWRYFKERQHCFL